MKIEKRKNSGKRNEANVQKNKNNEPKYKKIENSGKKEKIENKEKKENNINVNTKNTLTIYQIGDFNRYPEAMEIDGMDCE